MATLMEKIQECLAQFIASHGFRWSINSPAGAGSYDNFSCFLTPLSPADAGS